MQHSVLLQEITGEHIGHEGLSLVQRCIAGERAAQKEFFLKYAPKMKSLCMRFASCEDEASDMMQEGFIKAFDKLPLFRGQAALETWLTRLFINNNITILRKNKKWKDMSVSYNDNADLEEEADVTVDENEYLKVEDVIALMQHLPVGYRTVLNLYAIENMSHKEIGEALGINEGTSRSQLLKARRMMKSLLEKKR